MTCDVPGCEHRAEEEVTVQAVKPDGTLTRVTRILCVEHAGVWGWIPKVMERPGTIS